MNFLTVFKQKSVNLLGRKKKWKKKKSSYLSLDQNNSLELWKPWYIFQAFLETASKKNFSSRNKKVF